MSKGATVRSTSVWSFRQTLLFWWILFVVIQQAERLFLLPEALSREAPSAGLLVQTLLIGLRGDFIVASIGVVLAAMLAAAAVGLPRLLSGRHGSTGQGGDHHKRGLIVSGSLVGCLFLVLLTADMGYYHYNQHHLDFVFFEYLDDLLTQATEMGLMQGQAAQQTSAELQDTQRWALRMLGFFLVEGLAVAVWWACFRLWVAPAFNRWEPRSPAAATAALSLLLAGGAFGFHPNGPYAIRIANISSAEYYTLAQNPVLYASEAWRATVASRLESEQPYQLSAMPLAEAVRITQELVGNGAEFPDSRYPLVRAAHSGAGVRLARPANIVVIFVEALDRRFLNRDSHGVRVTPFLDRLRGESVYFENFFANGVQTARGLFASLCSYYPRQGQAAMKTRYAHDYLCLPSVLRRHGYRTEMVISEHRDLNRLQLFVTRNGLHQLFDQSDFPPNIEPVGSGPSLGKPDGALLDLMRARIQVLQASGKPFFLATLTLGTHHPFTVPVSTPVIRVLQADPDGYLAALRYLDGELERFFSELLQAGLLKNTVVLILGDHGRHEVVGQTEVEKQAGHFLAPLFLWVDQSLRTPKTYRPRTVATVASQVDLAPTLLGMNGLTPRVAPFLGRDLSCLLVRDCEQDSFAYLTSVYDDVIGLADRRGVLLYSLRTESLVEIDLELKQPPVMRSMKDPAVASRWRQLQALYVSSNILLDRNLIWSWKDLGAKL